MPVTAANMSYVSVVAFGLIAFVIGLWFTTKRGVFKGPRIDIELLEERRNAALEGESMGSVEVNSDSGSQDMYVGTEKGDQKVDLQHRLSTEK